MNRRFEEIWAVDFEFTAQPGGHPEPACMVAKEILSGRVLRLNDQDLRRRSSPPFGTSKDHLFIAYHASAEFSCFKALGWEYPANVVDMYVEFLNLRNGHSAMTLGKASLLDALKILGLGGDFLQLQGEKDEMRKLAMRGGPWTSQEMTALRKNTTVVTNLRHLGKWVQASDSTIRTSLHRLERAGLVNVHRPPGSNIRITLIMSKPNPPNADPG